MGSLRLLAAAALAAATLAGCGSANDRVAKANFGSVTALATTGNLRLVTERRRGADIQPVVCSEPSPDYAVAFDKKTDLALKLTPATPPPGTTPGNLDGTVGVDNKERVEEGEGRAAAVLALRDGLYAACQSYANGILGQDAYALILSQYGHLLVALVSGGRADPAAPKALEAAKLDTRRTTLSTLLVACMSGYDRTRMGDGPNILLTRAFCHDVLRASLGQALGRTKA
jgi:hypothetical protein